jgi:hypothetical protein
MSTLIGPVCQCSPGYTGINCEKLINYCLSTSCNNGSCTPIVNSFKCNCHIGFTGKNCQNLINYCDSRPCLNSGVCNQVSLIGYKCYCPTGWTGNNCEVLLDVI